MTCTPDMHNTTEEDIFMLGKYSTKIDLTVTYHNTKIGPIVI